VQSPCIEDDPRTFVRLRDFLNADEPDWSSTSRGAILPEHASLDALVICRTFDRR
jgi:hypothetical protein